MKVAVGSLNPVKIGAVRDAFVRVWPAAEVVGVDVPTGVSEMPMSDAECIAGAKNRAELARGLVSAEYGVGLEGGVNQEAVGLMLLGWVAIVGPNNQQGLACTAKIPLPNPIAQAVLAGEELGPLMDKILNTHDVRKKGGASGALSAGFVTRRDKFAMAVTYALSPFVASYLYEK